MRVTADLAKAVTHRSAVLQCHAWQVTETRDAEAQPNASSWRLAERRVETLATERVQELPQFPIMPLKFDRF